MYPDTETFAILMSNLFIANSPVQPAHLNPQNQDQCHASSYGIRSKFVRRQE